ncbi:1-deoxy-D-xylulose-5-phosphate reductoisomerase [Teredinibacter waterburyi]|uniref:1-deoxy-D-xylulose-5-phosphate reductoisomerase n=1 Tax=Teredinibacter waterburyi TaxID=1500538 RepID=UPI00165F47A3|nr:1-deoxy-D-xylulose-5-phosphate reductoisomerase [Teredinibacter waterburyi]
MAIQAVTVLGSTGSIGVNTLDVLAQHPDRFSVYALGANRQVAKLFEQCLTYKPRYAVMCDATAAVELQGLLRDAKSTTEVLAGEQGLVDVASSSEVDTVMAAIVGAAGLASTMAAVTQGKRVLLANKESLVMSGRLLTEAVRSHDAQLLPIDSEHNAIFQCLPAGFTNLKDAGIRRVLLTGSGGPFRQTPLAELASKTPDQACAHPNWSMGRKISVDSATMMNKGLEFIEACWLFNAQPDDIEIVVHPQSIVHSMVEYADGSVLAQMGMPDMRTPIANCLGWPERIESAVEPLNFHQLGALEFSAPDYERFPALKLSIQAMKSGGSYPIALNAANEVAVEAFLAERIGYLGISAAIENVLQAWQSSEPDSLEAVKAADKIARQMALVQVQSAEHKRCK